MNRLTTLGLLLAASLVGANPGPSLQARPCDPSRSRAVELVGSIWGHFDYTDPSWVGQILLKFGDQPDKPGTFVDRNETLVVKEDGAFSGTETITVTLSDGTFEIYTRFWGPPPPSPRLGYIYECGVIRNGTGAYAGISGWVVTYGTSIGPDFALAATGDTPMWMAEVRGSVCGLPD